MFPKRRNCLAHLLEHEHTLSTLKPIKNELETRWCQERLNHFTCQVDL